MLEALVFVMLLFCILMGVWRRGVLWFIAGVIAGYQLYVLTGSVELAILSFLVVLAGILSARVRR